jgi:Xaa-Pro aminopeptidase
MTISNISAERIQGLQSHMDQAGVDVVAIAPTPNMRYLLGFAPMPDERPCALLVSQNDTRLVVPTLNADQVEAHTGMAAIRWADAAGPNEAFTEALGQLGLKPGAVLAADDTMRTDAFLLLQSLAQPAKAIAAGDLMAALRLRKSADELERLARAAALTDQALLAGAAACRPGATERQVANVISTYFRDHGAESVDFTLVASGPHSAYPHHEIGDRPMQTGDTVILDIGATLGGYRSDITRVVQLGEPPAEVQAVYQAVLTANQRGRAAAVAGVKARQVDQAARSAIEQAGYGPYFFHRTGHGLGLEIHEPPWITSESDTILEPGMVFSVEPGVYLKDRFGIRIEDIVAVTEGECRVLTGAGHDLIINT